MKFIDNQNRSKLNEGRNYGIGFAFCKKTEDTLETVDPISACKDYLSDRVFTEATGTEFSAYGLTCKKEGIFSDGRAYLVAAVLTRGARTQEPYPGYEDEIKAMEEGAGAMQLLMQKIEELLKVDSRTVITKIDDNKLMVEVPLFWVDATYLISLYSLILRNGVGYSGSDPIEYLRSVTSSDAYMMGTAMKKLERFIANGTPKQNWGEQRYWHNYGIIAF